MKEDSPAVCFEAPERAAEGFAGGVGGRVGKECQVAREALALEVLTGDWTGRLGGERLEDCGAIPDDAGGAEFAEVIGEELPDGGWIFAGGRVLQAEFEGDEMWGEAVIHDA
jgi:hypothetical protein